MPRNYRQELLDGLYERLGRHARATIIQRMFLIRELTHVLSCEGERI